MILKGKIVFVALFALVALAGVVNAGLYTALIKFPPTDVAVRLERPSAPIPTPAGIVPRIETTSPPSAPPAVVPAPPPAPGLPEEMPPEMMPMDPGAPPDQALPEELPNMRRSEAFRDARKLIFQDGTQPDFSQFDEQERKALERLWDRYQVQRARQGGPRARNDKKKDIQ